MGAAVDVEAEQEETDPGSFVKYVHLAYPGQNQTVQDGGTEKEPVQVLERDGSGSRYALPNTFPSLLMKM